MTSPPYEVCEVGWGEFEILVDVYFKDYSKSVQIPKGLWLFHTDPAIPPSQPVVHEVYDEFVFVDPPEKLRSTLESGPTKTVPKSELDPYCKIS